MERLGLAEITSGHLPHCATIPDLIAKLASFQLCSFSSQINTGCLSSVTGCSSSESHVEDRGPILSRDHPGKINSVRRREDGPEKRVLGTNCARAFCMRGNSRPKARFRCS